MSIKNPETYDDTIILDNTQEYRNELFYMRLYYLEAITKLRNPRNSSKTNKQIEENIEDLIENIIHQYQNAKKEKKLPKEYMLRH